MESHELKRRIVCGCVCVYAILNERPREGKQICRAEIVKRYCNHETTHTF